MGAIGDVFEVIDHQRMNGQQVLNVYFYRLTTLIGGNSAEHLVASFIDVVIPDVAIVQVDDVVHEEVSARNLFNPSESWSELISEPGGSADDALPGFNAYAFRLIGDNSAVRDGQKRFAGCDEPSQTDGVVTDATTLTRLAALAATIVAGLAVGVAPDVFLPVIVGRILDGGSYRLPTSSGEAVISDIIDALFNVDVTSQTSRKIGVGA